MPARRESNRPVVIAVLATAAIILGVVFGPRLWRSLFSPAPDDATASAPVPPAPAMFEGVDVRSLHTELLPQWIVAQSQADLRRGEQAAFDALAFAVAPSPTLRELIAELRDRTAPTRLLEPGNVEQVLALVRRWNQTLDHAGLPYLLRANVVAGPTPFFYALSCEVFADSRVSVGGTEHRARLIRRVDRIPMREWYLGAVSEQEEGVIIVLDNVVAFAKDQLWPLLASPEHLAALGSVSVAFAPAVQAEIAAGLSEAHVERLRATASARAELMATVAAMHDRVARCGGGMQVNLVPWDGFREDELQRMRGVVADGRCPAITSVEHEVLVRSSAALREAEDLEPAVEALAAWAARPILVHEARHAADAADASAGRARACHWCDESDPQLTRMELSAYLAELAWTQEPAVALFQVCRATAESSGVGHAEALAVIFERADHYCEAGPLENVATVARALETEAFGHSDPIALVGALPERVPLRSLNLGQ